MKIIIASSKHIDQLAPLFDLYRVFYQQNSDIKAARIFLQERFNKKDSIVFMAFQKNEAIGFIQLYPTFSSVSLQKLFILNDLYVSEAHRKKGVAEVLLNFAKAFSQKEKAKGLVLETHKNNPAQNLYKRLNWKKDTEYFHYSWLTN